MIILFFDSKNKAREYFNFILGNTSIKTEIIILNDFVYQYDYEMFRVYVRVEDKKVLIFAEDELDFQWSENYISDYFLALFAKHRLNIKTEKEQEYV